MRPSKNRLSQGGAGAALFLLAACGGSGTPPPESSDKSERPEPAPDDPARALVGATVYDASGASKQCELPENDCPRTPRPADFLDACRLAGFQVRSCGCEELCSGNVATSKKHYDAQGNAKDCEPSDPACDPQDTSSAFQDGCTEAGHKLVVCGCEWLCTGKPR